MEATAQQRAKRRTRAKTKTQTPGASKSKPKRKPAQAERVVQAKKASKTTPMLSFRMDVSTRDLVDRAASAVGQNRTDFMVTTLREKAVEVLLNQRLFSLNDEAWTAFTESLDNPPPPNAKLKALLAREPIWDRQ
jgi:uncharacterized protein (DUF1778 family)